MKREPEIIILSGLSGSGKSSALNVLEDAGYFAIDNLPAPLLPSLVDLLQTSEKHIPRKLAIVMDAREMDFLKNFESYLKIFETRHIRHELFFFDARDDILLRRFSETRRRHPLSGSGRVKHGIQRERDILHPLREISTHIIDTSYMNIHELRANVLGRLRAKSAKKELLVSLISFGYRFGIPLEADLVLDVRFLDNPHFIEKLRPLSGENPKVSSFILRKHKTKRFLHRLQKMLELLLKEYLKEGKSYLVIGFGCTGGRHRSVTIANHLGKNLKQWGYPVKIEHRDLSREV